MLTMLAMVGFFISLSLLFIGYQHQFPGVLSDVTLSHSGQEIVFIEMSHIATPEFYIEKHTMIQALASSGYTILFE